MPIGVPLNVGAAGNVVAPTVTGAVVLPFPAPTVQALQNVRSGTQVAAFRKQIGDTVAPVLDVSADAYLPGYIGPGGLWTSPLLPSAGMVHCSLSLLSSQGGVATLNKYADALGAPLVSSTTATVTANAACTVGDDVVSDLHLRHKQHGGERRDNQRRYGAHGIQVANDELEKEVVGSRRAEDIGSESDTPACKGADATAHGPRR